MYIHFVGGFPKTSTYSIGQGFELKSRELIAIEAARSCYPWARIVLWTDSNSWHNAPTYCERREVPRSSYSKWPNYELEAGHHMSDKVRLYALRQYGGLYIDSDVHCLRPLNLLGRTKVLMANQHNAKTSNKLNNGIIFVPKPNNLFINKWIEHYKESTKIGYWDERSVAFPYKLAQQHPELIDHETYTYKQFHGTGWRGHDYYGESGKLPSWFNDNAKNAYFWHCIDSSHITPNDNRLGEVLALSIRLIAIRRKRVLTIEGYSLWQSTFIKPYIVIHQFVHATGLLIYLLTINCNNINAPPFSVSSSIS